MAAASVELAGGLERSAAVRVEADAETGAMVTWAGWADA